MPVLVDTSVWVDHLNRGEPALARLLRAGRVCTHEIVLGELLSGNLPARSRTSAIFLNLPRLQTEKFKVTLRFIEHHRLHGRGLNWNDLGLLASVAVADASEFWTRDKTLRTSAAEIEIPLFDEGISD
ncbi:MAG: PIN domain-containing protein [Chthoniobacterales bacterium]